MAGAEVLNGGRDITALDGISRSDQNRNFCPERKKKKLAQRTEHVRNTTQSRVKIGGRRGEPKSSNMAAEQEKVNARERRERKEKQNRGSSQ